MNFEQSLRLAGLHPHDIVPDGRWRRCKTENHKSKKNGAYKLDISGTIGWYRDWADGMGVRTWTHDGPTRQPTPADLARQRAHREAERARRIKGMRAARDLWAAGQPYRVHPYIAAKGLNARGCQVLRTWTGRVWHDGRDIVDTWLLVPMYWRDRLVNVQRISSQGLKLQMPAAPQKACSLIIGQPSAPVTVLCEGMATGLAIYQSMRAVRVLIAFNADNLVAVADEVKPRGSVVVAADNDWRTALKPHMHGVNPGIAKAQNAAELIGAGVTWPEEILGSDFADMLKEWGPPAARRIERQILAAARYVTREHS